MTTGILQAQKVNIFASLTFLLDEMGDRIDDLETHVTGLMAQAGIENANEGLTVRFWFYKIMEVTVLMVICLLE